MRLGVLFVCLGNICRSPTAHAVFQRRVEDAALGDRVWVDSAGTGDWHVGAAPDRRASAAALRRGFDMSALRARQVQAEDFGRFDYVLAMDRSNLQRLQSLRPNAWPGRLGLFLDYAPLAAVREVPDPYYGGEEGFTEVLDLIEAASDGLLEHLRSRLDDDNPGDGR
jgi:protein-tyrosine phosphatase